MSRWPAWAMTATILVAGSVMGAAGGARAASAVQQVPAAPAAGAYVAGAVAAPGGSCNAFSAAYQLPGSNGVVPAAYSDASLVVPACGPIPGTGGGPKVYPYPGALYTLGYQCVEFAERYLYYKYGATMGISTNGDQVVAHYGAKYPSLFSVVANGTASEAPVPGDVLSFSTVSTFNSASGGHTAVVQASSVNPAGNGSITIVEENAASSGVQVLTVSGWRVSYSGFPYIEWLHAASLLAVQTTSLPDAVVGSPYSAPLAAAGGKPPYAWQLSAGTLPSGLSLNSSGSITGTPVAEGPFPVTVTVTDSAGSTASASLLLTSDGPQLLLVRQGSAAPVIGKVGLGDSWTTLTSLTGKIAVAGNRIVVLTPGHVLWAKDGLAGTWYQEATGVTSFALDG
jgi:hypothetical protein